MAFENQRPRKSGFRVSRTARHSGVVALLFMALALGGCSLWLETKRPDYTDVSVVQKGTPRYDVTAALGKPTQSYQKDGHDVDVFQVDPKGRYTGTKVAVNTFNTAADIFSLGLWEVVATPAEMLTKHKLTTYVVTYTSDQTVASIEATAGPGAEQQIASEAANESQAGPADDAATPGIAATPAAVVVPAPDTSPRPLSPPAVPPAAQP
jgi:hypothetical protein